MVTTNIARAQSRIVWCVNAPRRRGLSLIEVLISIGVLGIGLLGVAALLPLASHQARQGVLEDRKAAVGKRAFREFSIRGMANPNNWILPPDSVTADGQPIWRPYCLDPIGWATPTAVANAAKMFPFAGFPDSPRMARITLSAQPNLGTIPTTRNNTIPTSLLDPMSLFQAVDVFTVEDDLQFDIPDDETLPPAQAWLDDAFSGLDATRAATSAGTKRIADGRFTWFATVVPDGLVPNEYYRLSIAIVSQRLPLQDMQEEHTHEVSFRGINPVNQVAFGGGDVTFRTSHALDFESGQWLLVSQRVDTDRVDFRWYQIIFVDANSGDVTLQGPDWRITGKTWAAHIPNVVAVYEKTIRLETSSLWTTF